MADWHHTSPKQLLDSHLNRTANTARAYASDIHAFAAFLKVDSPAEAVETFVGSERGAARRILEDWKNHHRSRGASLATTRRRMSSLMGLLSLAHEFGVIPWSIRMRLPAADPIKDVRGPGRDAIDRMLTTCEMRDDAKGLRDRAIISLLYFNALRAGEVLSLELQHVDLDEAEVLISAKGRWDRARIPIPRVTKRAIEDWIESRGSESGPLFVSMVPARRKKMERLTYRGLYAVVRKLGERAGVRCRPHGFRHTAASEMDRLSNGNTAWGMALTRHRDPKTLLLYNDNRVIAMRSAAEILAAGTYIGTTPDFDDILGRGPHADI